MAKASNSKNTPAKTGQPGTGLTKAEAAKGELISVKDYALIADPSALEAVRYNLQDEQISEFDLDRVKVPSGGGTVFQVPTIDGIQNMEEIEGVVLLVQIRRAYWENPDPTGTPPDCFSVDGLAGQGDPGGECSTCQFNEFGSAIKQNGEQGRGKRCRERRTILMLREEDRLPTVISAPPASIKGIKQFLMKLPVPMYQAVVRFSLVQDKSGDGIKYSKLVPQYVGHIGNQAGAGLLRYAETMRKVLVGQAPPASDFKDDDDDGQAGNIIDAKPHTPGGSSGDELPDDAKE